MAELLTGIPHHLQIQGRRLLQFLFAQKDFFVDEMTGDARLGSIKPLGPLAEYFENIINPELTRPDVRARILLQEMIRRNSDVANLPFDVNPALLYRVRQSNKRRRAIVPTVSDVSQDGDEEGGNRDPAALGEELANQSFLSSPSF